MGEQAEKVGIGFGLESSCYHVLSTHVQVLVFRDGYVIIYNFNQKKEV